MKTNAIPTNVSQVLSLAGEMTEGLSRHGETLPLPTDALATTQHLIATLRGAVQLHLEEKVHRGETRRRIRESNAALVDFVIRGKQFLRPFLGTRWTVAWEGLGLHGGSIDHSRSRSELLGIVNRMEAHLRQHPERESVSAGFTATRAAGLVEQTRQAESDDNRSSSRLKALARKREEALTKLQNQMRHIRSSLKTALEDDSPVWIEFGLHRPSDRRAPTRPKGLSLEAKGEVWMLSWSRATRAERYRIWSRDPQAAEVMVIDATRERWFVLEDVAPGQQISISATNAAGESRRSQELVVPVPRKD